MLLLVLILAGYFTRIQGQPCDCQWPVDVTILHLGSMQALSSDSRMKNLSDSLRKKPGPMITLAPGVVETPYMIKKMGQGNRIVFISVPADGIAGEEAAVNDAMQYSRFKEKAAIVAVSSMSTEGNILLARRMPQLDLILGSGPWSGPDTLTVNGVLIARSGDGINTAGEVFLRLSKGRVIFRKAGMIPVAR